MTDFVDEPDCESTGIDAQRESGEKWRAIHRRHLPAVQEQHAREKRRSELEETEQRRAESRRVGSRSHWLFVRPGKKDGRLK
jgi:hypothetical protein